VIQGGRQRKTTIALHRIAFLVFQDPKRFRPSGSWWPFHTRRSPRTPPRCCRRSRRGRRRAHVRAWALEHRLARFRVAREHEEDTPPVVSRLKKHPAMLAHLARRAAAFAREVDASIVGGTAEQPMGDRVAAAGRRSETMISLPTRRNGRVARGTSRARGAGKGSRLDGRPTTWRAATSSVRGDDAATSSASGRRADLARAAASGVRRGRSGAVTDSDLDELVRWCASRAAGSTGARGRPTQEDAGATTPSGERRRATTVRATSRRPGHRHAVAEHRLEARTTRTRRRLDPTWPATAAATGGAHGLDLEDERSCSASCSCAAVTCAVAARTAPLRAPRDRRGAGLLSRRARVLVDTVTRGRSITMAGDTAQRLV